MTQAYFASMVRLACELADAHGATLFLVDGLVLRPYVIYNLPRGYISGIGTVKIGTQCCGRAVACKKPWIVSDMLNDPLFADGRNGAVESPIRAAFSVPVLDGEKAIGSLACHFIEAHSPSKVDVERNEVFARLISIALHGQMETRIPEPHFSWAFEPTPGITPSGNVYLS